MKKNGKIKFDPRNARRHGDTNKAMIRESLQEVGAFRSIALDGNNIVRAGNGVYEQAQALGYKVKVIDAKPNELIAVRRPDLKGKKAIRAALYDNRTGELSEWDADILSEMAEQDKELLAGIFDDKALAEFAVETLPEETDDEHAGDLVDKAEELNKKWKVKLGDLWECGEHRVMCGDCTHADVVNRLMQGEKARCSVTDPPYGINRNGILNDDPKGLKQLFDDTLSIAPIENAIEISFQSPRLFPIWLDSIRLNGHKFERMLWMYKPNDETYPWRGWLQKSEAILVSSVGKGEWLRVDPFANDCYVTTNISNDSKNKEWVKGLHPSVKSLSIVQDLVSRVGGLCYDPFLGSGTTLIACENLKRKCRAIELNPAYVAVTLQRWSDLTGKKPKLIKK